MVMKKVVYDSRVAKVLLCLSNCHTIMLGGFVFSTLKEEEMAQATRNHECVHARQWIEMTVLCGILVLVPVLAFGVSAWWMLLSGLVFYVWYVLEWAYKGLVYWALGDEWGCEKSSAYANVSFEREARFAAYNSNYLENAGYFGWLKEL